MKEKREAAFTGCRCQDTAPGPEAINLILGQTERKRLLLHSCCGPCSTACIERLAPLYEITVFYYNPCITEREEYEKRKAEQIRFITAYKRDQHLAGGKDCVFTYYGDIEDWNTYLPIKNCCLCALEKAYRAGRTHFCKPISCALYPIREKQLGEGLIGLNYNRWSVCKMAIAKGIQENLYLYQFLRDPLIRRFGDAWYQELLDTVRQLKEQGYL